MVNRIVVGAHYGLGDWLLQRLTAVVMAVYLVLGGVVLLSSPPSDYPSWKALFAPQWFRVATLIFCSAFSTMPWVGMRDILMTTFSRRRFD
jgi:succinate dehydrogenase / fumarate reductase membrane anchor subunit